MQKILNWFTNNSAFVIAIAIVIFTLLTAILLITLLSSNSGAKKQMALLAKTMQYDYRPRILPKFVTVDEKIRCLVFENAGTQYAKNVHITIDDEWLEAKEKLPDFQSNNQILRELSKKKLTLCPEERLVFSLYIIGAANVDLFKCQPLKVVIRYNDNSGRIRYEESFLMDLSVYEDTIATGSEYARGVARLSEKLEKLETALKDIDYRISEISNVGKRTLDFKIKTHLDPGYDPDDDSKRKKRK